ncbi:hypothetical protein Tco_1165341 [Tanacetum coccineum]
MKWPPISASIIIRPLVPSSSSRGGNENSGSGEKLWCPPVLPLLSNSASVLHEDTLLLRCFSGATSIPLERELW